MSALDQIAYSRPTSLSEAVAQLQAPGAMAVAGGTDLINGIRLGKRTPQTVVDLAAVPELSRLDDGDPMSIGGGVTIRAFRSRPDLVRRLPALADAAALLGGRQIQAMATFGGNLCNASPAAETATPLLALGATVRLTGPAGERTVSLERFWVGPGRTVLTPGEVLVSIDLPTGLDASASAYRRLELRRSVDIALVAASCWLRIANGRIMAARIALGAVAPTPMLAVEAADLLVGAPVDDPARLAVAVRSAARAAAAAASPIDDHRATGEYRRAMTEQLAAQAVHAAITSRHARNEEPR